ncbi:MAG: hypothetical protein HXY50_02250, partial [Ignavibacteriaceae bacterium]|nr:hypothetical protein [Ignavibacteriaceae bacterium]
MGANSVIHHSRTDAWHSKDSLEYYGFDDVIIFNAYNNADYIHHYSGGYYTRWEAENNELIGGKTPVVKYEFGIDSGTSWMSGLSSNNIGKYLITGPDYVQDRKYKFYYDTSTISYSVNFRLRIDGSLTAGDSVCEISVRYRTIDNKDSILSKKKLFDFDLSNSFDTIRLHYTIPEKIYGTTTEIPYGIISGGKEKYGDAHLDEPYDGSYGVQFNVKWLGNRNLYVDYIEVYDDNVWANYLEDQSYVKNLISSYSSTYRTNNTRYWYSLDEPQSIDNYEPYKMVQHVLDSIGSQPLITAFYPAWDGKKNHEFTIKRFLETVQPERLMYDYYPYYYGDDYPDEKCLRQQHDLMQEPFIESYGFPPIGDYYYVVQSFGYTPECSTDADHQSRKPNSRQLRASVMLALAHGTKGIFFWPYYSYNTTSKCGTILTNAIVDTLNNPTELYYEIKNNIFSRLNSTLGNTLVNLKYKGNYINVTQQSQLPVSNDYLTLQSNGSDFNWHAGLLLDKKDSVNNKYFLLVNLRTDTVRTAKLEITNNSGYNNLRVRNVEDSSLDTTVTSSACTLYQTLQAGDGKLYQVAPVVKYGGKIKTNETISLPISLLGELTVESGATLTISANYDIYKNITVNAGGSIIVTEGKQLKFYDGAYLNVNGNLTANGSPTD